MRESSQEIRNTILALLLALTAGVIVAFFLALGRPGQQGEVPPDPRPLRYESIQIQSTDTLWSIAEAHRPPQESTKHYLDRIVFLNSLQVDQHLHAGAYLVVPVFGNQI